MRSTQPKEARERGQCCRDFLGISSQGKQKIPRRGLALAAVLRARDDVGDRPADYAAGVGLDAKHPNGAVAEDSPLLADSGLGLDPGTSNRHAVAGTCCGTGHTRYVRRTQAKKPRVSGVGVRCPDLLERASGWGRRSVRSAWMRKQTYAFVKYECEKPPRERGVGCYLHCFSSCKAVRTRESRVDWSHRSRCSSSRWISRGVGVVIVISL